MNKKSAFTLVELMVVIAIIAILAVGSVTGYSSYLKKARDNTRLQIAIRMTNDLLIYRNENNSWPVRTYGSFGCILSDGTNTGNTCDGGSLGFSLFAWGSTPSEFTSIEGNIYPYVQNQYGDYEIGVFYNPSTAPSSAVYSMYIGFGFELEGTCDKLNFLERFPQDIGSVVRNDDIKIQNQDAYFCRYRSY